MGKDRYRAFLLFFGEKKDGTPTKMGKLEFEKYSFLVKRG